MNLCGISPIPILITFLCCAALFVYFNLRLAEIKNAVEKQNKVLTAFITNVQQDIQRGGCDAPRDNLASPEAMNVVRKIEVSDDEYESDSDSDSESDSDSDSDSDGDSDEHDNRNNMEHQSVQDSQQMDLNDIVQLSDVGMNMNDEQMSVSVLAFEVLGTSHSDIEHENATTSSISEITDETLSLDAHHKNDATEENTSQSFDSMKVDDLRTTVISQNLASKEDAKKLKKPELLALLKK